MTEATSFRLDLTVDEVQFLQQLFDSDVGITLKTVEVVAGLRKKVMSAAHSGAAHAAPQTPPQPGAEAL
jgi:hypothetical protein